MKNLKFSILFLALVSIIMFSCEDEEDPDPSLVNFAQEAYNITTDDLTPFEVTLTIEPAATSASEIVVSLSGATPGTEFNTSPAASDGSVTIPVTEGDTEVSFTVTPDAEGIGFNNVNIDMMIFSVGEGLTTGISTEAAIAITNTLDTGTDIPYSETFNSCADDGAEIPSDWEVIIAQQNSKGTAGWKCVPRDEGCAASNPFNDCADDISDPSEAWLVAPRLNLTQATNATLTFDATLVFGPLETLDYDIKISTDYNGSNFDASTWTRLEEAFTALEDNTRSGGGENELQTVGVDLSSFSGNVVSIAFIHLQPGTGCTNSSVFRIKNFSVSE